MFDSKAFSQFGILILYCVINCRMFIETSFYIGIKTFGTVSMYTKLN